MTTDAADAAAPEAQQVRRRGPAGDELHVSATTNPQSLASAISFAIYESRACSLRTIGAGATQQAVKAVAIARGFVAPRGFDIAMIPGFKEVTGARGDEITALVFRIVQLG